METHETKQDPVEMLIRYLTRGRDDLHVYAEKCTHQLYCSAVSLAAEVFIAVLRK